MFDPATHDNVHVTIVGLGNIGSNTAIALARMGLQEFTLYDDDAIEAHNLSSQAYAVADIGALKVNAIADKMRAVNPTACVSEYDCKIDGDNAPTIDARKRNIIISAVDSLDARRAIAATLSPDVYVIDGRMGGGQIEVHSQTASQWLATIPEAADDDACGARFISYTALIIAGLIANNVKRYLNGEAVKSRILLHADTLEIITA